MTADTALYLTLGALAGGFINGFAGTGMALFALGFFLVVLDPLTAVAVIALMSISSGLQGLWMVRHQIAQNPRRLARFLVPGLLGVPLGVMLLGLVDDTTLRWLVALLLVGYGGYFGFRSALPRFERPTPRADICVGLLGGIMGGLASLSGALPSIWLSMRPWPKRETRAVLQPFNVVILSCTAISLAAGGAYDRETLIACAVALPVTLGAVQIGMALFHRVSDDAYRRVLIILCLVFGLGILLREALSL